MAEYSKPRSGLRAVRRGAAAAALLVALAAVAPAQDGYRRIAFQGALALKPGAPALDANPYAARFALFTAPTGGSPVWQEDQSILIQNGIYRVELGAATPLPEQLFRDYADLWLEVTIDLARHGGSFLPGDVFSPRHHVTAAPYAFDTITSRLADLALGLEQPNGAGDLVVESNADTNGHGFLTVYNAAGQPAVQLWVSGGEGTVTASSAGGASRALLSSFGGQGDLSLLNGSNKFAVNLASSQNEGLLTLYNTNEQARVQLGSLSNNGYLALRDATNNVRILLDAFNGTKNFVEPDPRDATRVIVYTCLEGPEAAIFCRGTAKLTAGEATVPLPESFALLCADEGITVQVTPQAATSLGLAVVARSPSAIVVRELGGGKGDYAFDYQVMGVRKGLEHYQPVQTRDALQRRFEAQERAVRDAAQRQPPSRPAVRLDVRPPLTPAARAATGR